MTPVSSTCGMMAKDWGRVKFNPVYCGGQLSHNLYETKELAVRMQRPLLQRFLKFAAYLQATRRIPVA